MNGLCQWFNQALMATYCVINSVWVKNDTGVPNLAFYKLNYSMKHPSFMKLPNIRV